MKNILSMRTARLLAATSIAALIAGCAMESDSGRTHYWQMQSAEQAKPELSKPDDNAYFRPSESVTEASVSVEGNSIDYRAIAGRLVVHPKGYDDAAAKPDAKPESGDKESNQPSEAGMFFVAYFKEGENARHRPITFVYNGGPGSATVWLHMGAWGPKRIVTAEDTHTPAAPYHLVNNDFSLLDASDLVFIDAPGTGFSRIRGKNKDKDFLGADADVHAFSEFITQFLTKYGRWNSPKYLFGESYGTPRSANLI